MLLRAYAFVSCANRQRILEAQFLAFAIFATMVLSKEDIGTIKLLHESKHWGAKKISNFSPEKNRSSNFANRQYKNCSKCNVLVLNRCTMIKKSLFRPQYLRPEPSAWNADCRMGQLATERYRCCDCPVSTALARMRCQWRWTFWTSIYFTSMIHKVPKYLQSNLVDIGRLNKELWRFKKVEVFFFETPCRTSNGKRFWMLKKHHSLSRKKNPIKFLAVKCTPT